LDLLALERADVRSADAADVLHLDIVVVFVLDDDVLVVGGQMPVVTVVEEIGALDRVEPAHEPHQETAEEAAAQAEHCAK
jgi:hypothetical protein